MMGKSIYRKMAEQNIKKNSGMYFPYIMTFVGMAAMYYILVSIASNPTLSELKRGSRSIPILLGFGTWIVAVFAVIFLFYTNSFLIKRRKKELGLYNILGMEKRHISRILMWENVFVLAIGLIFGMLFGVLFDKLLFMILLKMLGESVPVSFYFSWTALGYTTVLFSAITLLIHLNSMRQVHFSNPVDLLKGGNVGEKEPKTKIVFAILGAISLCTGYGISVTTKNPFDAFGNLFIAILLVIIGTYLLFISGSIAMLKLLRNNKKYYYKPNHFISVSGMIYRMKQNAVGLANICILCSAVIITISTTVALRVGIESVVRASFPYDVMTAVTNIQQADGETVGNANVLLHSVVDETIDELEITTTNEIEFTLINFYVDIDGNIFSESELDSNNFNYVFVVSADEYNKITGSNISLNKNEVLCYNEAGYKEDNIVIVDTTYSIVGKIDKVPEILYSACWSYPNLFFFVVDSSETMNDMLAIMNTFEYDPSETNHYYYFNIASGSEENCIAIPEVLQKKMSKILNEQELNYGYSYESYYYVQDYTISMYSGLLFVGIFLGVLFLMATVLIIYYKQITEGHEDAFRYQIMQKVGLSHREVKSSINSQVMTVFFLPLVTAIIHMCFAFPVVNKFLNFNQMDNSQLYLICMVASTAIFAAIYVIIYIVTSKAYYKIVTQRENS